MSFVIFMLGFVIYMYYLCPFYNAVAKKSRRKNLLLLVDFAIGPLGQIYIFIFSGGSSWQGTEEIMFHVSDITDS